MITLQSSMLRIDVLPEVGGKISQIQDKRSHRELLIPAQKPYQPIPWGDQWMDYDTSGIDDCFPNIAPGPYPFAPWEGLPLPQLGEWVYGSWDVESTSKRQVTLNRAGVLLPYRARKIVGLADDQTLEVQYAVENLSAYTLRYIWCAHSLFVADQAFRLTLPDGDLSFRVFPADGARYQWPTFHSVDLSCQWIPCGSTLKIFVSGLSEGWCELWLGDYRLHMSFDLTATPFLGLWFNHYGFPQNRPFRCIAIEPCTAPSDLLDELGPDAYPLLEPGSLNQWWFKLRVA
jgi:hypothetical protein